LEETAVSSNQQDSPTASDDDFHMLSSDPWETETYWFSFNVPERNLAGWLYAWVRPNLHNCGGGVFVYDDTAVASWGLPYFQYQHTQPLPAVRDLRDFTFPNGYSVKMLDPLRRYALRYQDRDHIRLDLEFTAIQPPHRFPPGLPPFDRSGHLDQAGRVVGTLVLRGETLRVDCFATRDRSWGVRQDHRGNRLGYSFGTASERDSFCAFVQPTRPDTEGRETVYHGNLVRDGRMRTIRTGWRVVERDRRTNHITGMTLEGVDEDGRRFRAVGTARSRMIFSVPRGTCMNTFLHWRFDNGVECHGEDQDVWRHDQWRTALEQLRGKR
jgi:hypothetical protein